MFFILFAIVASASANSIVKSECPDVKTVENFDFNAYRQGKWYEFAKYPNPGQGDSKCGYSVFTPEGDGFKINSYDVAGGKHREMSGTGKLAPDAGTNGKLLYSFAYGPKGSLVTSPVSVVFTDYNNYAVIYFCKFNEKKQSIQELSWVLSRSKIPEPDSKATVESLLKESPYLDAAKYIWNDFTEEACKDV